MINIKRKTAIILGVICALCFSFAIGVCFYNGYSVKANQVDFATDHELLSEYYIGQTLTVETEKLIYNQKQYDASPLIYCPDGTVKNVNQTTINQDGVWKVVYKAVADDGKIISKNVEFTVKQNVFSVGDKVGAVRPYTHTYIGSNGQETSRNGLLATLAMGDSLTYNKVIDLNEVSIGQSLVNMYVLPRVIGTPDAASIIITFTDVYDSENKVDVIVHQQTGDSKINSYIQARATGQTYVGLHRADPAPNKVQVGSNYYTVYRGGIYGALLRFAFGGECWNNKVVGEEYITVSWDYANRAVYGRTAHATLDIIADLDESYMVSDWDGFTTGEVIMSVSCAAYNNSEIDLFFSSICGEDFSVGEFSDDVAPIISAEYQLLESLPTGVAGGQYRLFDATAFDVYDGEVPVSVTAYYGYGTNKRVMLNITDGYIKTDYIGDYTFVYRAEDLNGNVCEEIITVNVKKEQDVTPVMTFIGLEQAESATYYAGSSIELLDYSLTNRTPEAEITIKAVHRDTGKIEKITNGCFTATERGDYDIVYNYKSHVFDIDFKYSLTASAPENEVFIQTVNIPKYFIYGAKYEIPKLYANDFTNNRLVEAEVYLAKDGSSTPVKFEGAEYTVDAQDKVDVIYKVGEQQQIYNVKVINPKELSLDISKYFYVTEGQPTLTRLEVGNKYEFGQDGFSMDFVKEVLVGNFGFNFSTAGQDVKVKITLSELYSTECITIEFIDGKFSVNGGEYVNSEEVFSMDNTIELSYTEKSREIKVGSTSKVVNSYLSGKEFNGFNGDVANLTIEVSGSGEYLMRKINNQNTNNIAADRIKPEISHLSDADKGKKRINDVYYLAEAHAGDVLNPNLIFTMYVKDPDGNFVTSTDGVLLDETADPNREYSFVLTKYGKYSVYYYYGEVDSDRNHDFYLYTINVNDEEKPQIKLYNVVNTGRVGEDIKFAIAELYDNMPLENASVYKMVKNPYGIIEFANGESFKATVEGVYTITYVAYDAQWNMQTVSYAVTISAKGGK